MKLALALLVSSLSTACLAQWPATPQPQPTVTKPPVVTVRSNDYAAGFSFDNQLYALQGGGVAIIVGTLTYRPWAGLAAGDDGHPAPLQSVELEIGRAHV